MRLQSCLLVPVGSLALILGLSLPMLTGSARAQATQERFGPGRVNCADQWCYLVGIQSLGTGTLAQFAHSMLPESKQQAFVAECLNSECLATLTGTRVEPRSMMVTPSDIEWRKAR